MPVKPLILKIGRRSVAHILTKSGSKNSKNQKHFEQLGSFTVVKNGDIFVRSHTTSCSPSKATMCLSHAVSEMWRDKKNGWIESIQIGCHGNRQCPSRNRKTNFSSFIYSHGSIIPADFVKIGLIDVEIIGLTEIVTKFKCEATNSWL